MIHQRARNRHALPLSSGEFVRLVHHAVGEIDLLERFFGALQTFFRRSAVVNHGQLHVVQSRGARQQIERLKHEPDFAIANRSELVVVELAHQPSRQPVVSLRRRIQAADQIHERGFSGAGGTHDGDVFAFADHDVHAAQRVELLGAHFVGFPELFGLDDHAGIDQILAKTLRFDFVDSHGHWAPRAMKC